jgi:phospholipid-binding lipoprotein MlaA
MKTHQLAALLIAAAFLGGCASVPGPSAKGDPLESFNRASYAFNDAVDKAVLKPVAQGYQAVTPSFVRAGVTNAFENVSDVKTALNNLLQGKVGNAASDVGRVVVNTVLGVFGLWDVATPMGLEKHEEDFGQTLGKWGVGSGPFIMLPLLGPSTLRDSVGRVPDSYAGYNYHIDHRRTANSLFVTEIINGRAGLLAAEKTLDEAALDKYIFLRDAYLQRRLRLVHDGKVPQSELDRLEDSLEPAETGAKPAAGADKK